MGKSKRLFALANVLTISRFALTAGLIWLVLGEEANTLYALMLFVVGELTDALDGSLARKAAMEEFMARCHFSYIGEERAVRKTINDRRRPWVILDQVTDILLLGAMAIYCFWRFQLGWWWQVAAIVLIIMAVAVQVQRNTELRDWGKLSRQTLVIVLIRRVIYLVIIATILVKLIIVAPLVVGWKVLVIVVGAIIGLAISVLKFNRLTEDKTPFV